MKAILFCILAAFPVGSTFAQTTTVKFYKRVLKLDAAPAGEQLSLAFSFTNSGEVPLVLNDYQVSCECTTVDLPKEPVMPGQQGRIEVRFDSSGKIGWQYRKIRLVGNTRKELEVEFRVKILTTD